MTTPRGEPMNDHDDPAEFPERADGDVQYRLAQAAIGAADALGFPGLGYGLQQFVELVVGDPIKRRQAEWFSALARDLADLARRVDGFDLKRLAMDEEFVSLVLQSSEIAARSSDETKRL